MTNCLNPLNIFWGIVVIEEGNLSNSQISSLNKATGTGSFDVNKKSIFFHGGKSYFDARLNNVKSQLKASGVHGKIYVITDKQFGMIQNSWTDQKLEVAKPFTKSVTLKHKNEVTLISLTEKQFNEAHIF